MIRLRNLLPWDRHERWRREVSYSLDGELSPTAARRLRQHLADCEACRAYERDLRSARASLAALRDVEAPRSFRLTPAMVVAPVRPPVHEPYGGLVMRGAQLATALAVVALAVVSIVDFSDSGSTRSSNSTASLADTAPQSAKSAPNAADAAGGAAFGSAPEDAHAPQPAGTTAPATPSGGGVAIPTPRGPNSAGTGCDAAQPLNPGAPTTAPSQPAPCASASSASPEATSVAGTPPPAGTPNSNQTAPAPAQRPQSATGEPAIAPATAATTTKAGWYRPAEVGLGLLAAIAAVAVIVLSLRTRRS